MPRARGGRSRRGLPELQVFGFDLRDAPLEPQVLRAHADQIDVAFVEVAGRDDGRRDESFHRRGDLEESRLPPGQVTPARLAGPPVPHHRDDGQQDRNTTTSGAASRFRKSPKRQLRRER